MLPLVPALALTLAYKVPPGVGSPMAVQPGQDLRTLADVARDRRSDDVARDRADASLRPLNLDFIPRFGWRGTVFPSVMSPILFSVASSAAVLVAHDAYGFDGINPTAHTVLGVLVSFLSVFRTQQAYNRYWEGRGHLGSIMATVVDIASTASVQLSGAELQKVTAAREELARLLRLYFKETVRFLRRTSRTTQRVSNYWLPQDVASVADGYIECDVEASSAECEALSRVPRPPVLVLQWIRAHLYRAGIEEQLIPGSDDAERMQSLQLGLEQRISHLQPSFNGAAKIATTPAPQPYTQMGRWLVFWFVFTLPLALIGTFGGLGTSAPVSLAFVPAGMLLAFGYYGLDYCATQLQNPYVAEFGDVQLDGRFMQAVCADVDTLLLVSNEAK